MAIQNCPRDFNVQSEYISKSFLSLDAAWRDCTHGERVPTTTTTTTVAAWKIRGRGRATLVAHINLQDYAQKPL